MKLTPLLFSFVLLSQSASAAVVLNDAVLSSPSSFGDFDLSLTQSISSGGGAVFVSFNNAGNGLYQFDLNSTNTYSIAEAFRLYLVIENTPFDANYVNGNTPLFSNAAPANWSLSIPINSSRIIAYWDDRTFLSQLPAVTEDNYGWVRLTNTASGLVATDGATAIGGGIIAGTITQIPELSSMILAFSSCVLVMLRRKR